MAKSSTAKPKRSFQNPKGTRDFFPEDQLRQRYITDSWRRVALRHGFDEIDGPTFEHLNLYTVKSGEDIVSELFSFTRHGGDDTYALRPEFTPTLARMYAARAKQLPTPVKWFSICNYFRAEKPQRGRLREFMQLNCDVIGLGGEATTESTEDTEKRKAEGDGELAVCCSELLRELGMEPRDAVLRLSDRSLVVEVLRENGVEKNDIDAALNLLDRWSRLSKDVQETECARLLPDIDSIREGLKLCEHAINHGLPWFKSGHGFGSAEQTFKYDNRALLSLIAQLRVCDLDERFIADLDVVRGLAYYTGTVFEAIAEGERAVAGGGRYDGLIKLMGGESTPAAGFAMGDVVLGNILDDKGLIPDGRELLEALSRPMPVRPDVFVVAASDEARQQVVPLVARLRRGVEADDAREKKPWDESRYAIAPLHARRSYKATTKMKKLLQEAGACHARLCVIVEDAETCSIKDLDLQQQTTKPVPLDTAHEVIASGDLSRYL